jgi:signal transduction histidine kinase
VHGLYGWLRRHPKVVDGFTALLVVCCGFAFLPVWRREPVLLPITVVLAVPVAFRRTYPVGAFAAGIAVGAVQVLAVNWPTGADVSIMILLYTLAACRPRRTSALGLLACLLGAAIACLHWRVFHDAKPATALTFLGFLAALPMLAWLFGDSVRWRRGYYTALEERARRLESERDALAQVTAAAERARIARELHDVVAHHVSVMVVQADGAAFALERSPEKASAALTAISTTGRQALAEMRRLLGVLRSPEQAAADLAPVPGTGDLGTLLEQAGIPVTFSQDGRPRPLAEGADLTVYRIVQEALTNVRKHGGHGVAAAVALRHEPDQLTVTISDDGRGAAAADDGAGHGLAGMRERVELYGGKVTAGPKAGGGYQVTATLPAGEARAAEARAAEARAAEARAGEAR